MRLGILSRNRQLFSVRRLLKEARSRRVHCEVFDPLDCQIVVGRTISNIYIHDRPLPELDVIIPRIGASITDYGLAVVRQLELRGVVIVNSAKGIADSRDKLRCLQILAEKGFDVPVTVLMRGSRWLRSSLKQVHGTPVILKLLQGTQGVGVMLAESAASAESVLDTMEDLGQHILLQQYISESGGRDIRAFVIGNEVVAAMRRQARDGDFRSNLHRGGEGVWIELKDQYKRVAVQAVKTLGLTFGGVDMLESLAGPMVLEVNSSPGFEGIESATGLNIARMIIDHSVSLYNRSSRSASHRKRKVKKATQKATRRRRRRKPR